MFYDEERDAKRLWDFLLQQVYGTDDFRSIENPQNQDREAHAFFLAMDYAFAGSSGRGSDIFPIHRELVQYLAGWCRDSTNLRFHYPMTGGPVGEYDSRNHFLARAFEAFIQTLRQAIKADPRRYAVDRPMFGCLELPKWLVDKYIAEGQMEAEHIRNLQKKYPLPLRVVS